jgi:hypothetical protein
MLEMGPPLIEVVLVFCGRTEPYVRIAFAPIVRQHFANVLGPLGQQQPIQSSTPTNQGKQIDAPRCRNLIIENISYRSTEHALTSLVVLLKFTRPRIPSERGSPIRLRRWSPRAVAPCHKP